MSDASPKTVVELRDHKSAADSVGPHIAQRVLVNGSPVRVEVGGVDVDFGPSEQTVVTLRLLADEVHFTH